MCAEYLVCIRIAQGQDSSILNMTKAHDLDYSPDSTLINSGMHTSDMSKSQHNNTNSLH